MGRARAVSRGAQSLPLSVAYSSGCNERNILQAYHKLCSDCCRVRMPRRPARDALPGLASPSLTARTLATRRSGVAAPCAVQAGTRRACPRGVREPVPAGALGRRPDLATPSAGRVPRKTAQGVGPLTRRRRSPSTPAPSASASGERCCARRSGAKWTSWTAPGPTATAAATQGRGLPELRTRTPRSRAPRRALPLTRSCCRLAGASGSTGGGAVGAWHSGQCAPRRGNYRGRWREAQGRAATRDNISAPVVHASLMHPHTQNAVLPFSRASLFRGPFDALFPFSRPEGVGRAHTAPYGRLGAACSAVLLLQPASGPAAGPRAASS